MPNFFSAFDMMRLRIFSALTVRVEACIKVIPYGFGAGDKRWGVLISGEGIGDGEGAALVSFGEAGRPGHLVLENEEVVDTADIASDKEESLECLLSVFVIEEDALLKSDLAGDVVTELPGDSARFGDWVWGEGSWGRMLTSLRTTMSERWSLFRANRLDT